MWITRLFGWLLGPYLYVWVTSELPYKLDRLWHNFIHRSYRVYCGSLLDDAMTRQEQIIVLGLLVLAIAGIISTLCAGITGTVFWQGALKAISREENV